MSCISPIIKDETVADHPYLWHPHKKAGAQVQPLANSQTDTGKMSCYTLYPGSGVLQCPLCSVTVTKGVTGPMHSKEKTDPCHH